MAQSMGLHLITVASILTFKLTALVIGYLVVKMGYELLVKGITGEFKFKGSIAGGKADLVSASPGLLFLLLGIILMASAILKDKPFSTSIKHESNASIETNPPRTKPDLNL